jgi:hypothetical protein
VKQKHLLTSQLFNLNICGSSPINNTRHYGSALVFVVLNIAPFMLQYALKHTVLPLHGHHSSSGIVYNEHETPTLIFSLM